ncbi:methylmalonyl-CoA epimerase [Pseudokineococcus lusitanus]|uniref:Methylmalonyl-CoA epimerase n=1 Tax=Pseudokineococcus lusitanus TaxID=763993 RepID=A0A3N1HN12_9ACTN|nr:methylmalonyl-CoA epimerase [Pseudokineococcus lusitanus]ROP43855.1 methylmalonyl-CoA epimerase [Pseudokineococcus lusitanus]
MSTEDGAARPAVADVLGGGPAPQLLGLDHVGVATADLAAALDLHVRVLGMRVVHEETNEEQGVHEVMLVVGPLDDGPRVQLLAPTGAGSPVARFLDRRGPGLQQVAYRVRDVAAATAALTAAGLRVLPPAVRTGTAGSRVAFVHPADAGGVLVELVEHVPDAPDASDAGDARDGRDAGAPA